MKKSINSTVIFIIVIALISRCEKLGDFGNTNVNPSTTRSPVTSALLTNVLTGLSEYSDSYPDFYNWAALYCQYASQTYITERSRYIAHMSSPMNFYYSDLYDLQNIILINTDETTMVNASENGANENQIAIARILKAYIFWTITDRWGDIPYTDALKGEPNVSYDPQESIYKNLLTELTEAVAQFTEGAPIKGDIVYEGKILKWKKFANSLRMLMSLRLSEIYPLATDYASTQFKAGLEDAAGSIETNDDNFQLNFPGGSFRNPYYIMYDAGGYTGESETMTTLLQSLNNDQRQTVFGSDANGFPSNTGVPYGRNDVYISSWIDANPTWCYIFSPEYRKVTSPVYIITASQILLARAEAADRGWTSETPNTAALYQEGITLSYLQWGLDAPDMTYFNSPNIALVEPPGTGANLKQIAIQQYIAFYPDGVQGWSNWRRTNYPELLPAPDASNDPKVIPRRYMYGPEDYTLTKAGVEEAVARLSGGDRMDSRVWWDKE